MNISDMNISDMNISDVEVDAQAFEQVQLEFERIMVAEKVDMPIANVTMKQFSDHLTRALTYALVAWVAGRTMDKATVEFSAPLTWWDHVKERWFPDWAKSRWPVRMRVEQHELKVRQNWPAIIKGDRPYFNVAYLDGKPNDPQDARHRDHEFVRRIMELMHHPYGSPEDILDILREYANG